MKKIKNIVYLTIVFLLSSCSFENHDLELTGQPIMFGITVEGQTPVTRTKYTGSTDVTGERERIDWLDEDKIYVHMYSDNGEGDYWNSQKQDHQIYQITRHTSQGAYMSVANVDKPLEWTSPTYKHYFVGIYPSDFGTYQNWNGRSPSDITFTLPDEQDGNMDNAFMAAITKSAYVQGESVALDFFPMITTLYFTFNNDTEEDQEVKYLELEEKNNYKALVGSYIVACNLGGEQFYPRDYGFNGPHKVTLQVNQPVAIGESISMPLFIIPQDRDASNMYVDIFLSNKKLSNSLSNKQVSTFEALKKYNITVNLSGGGVVVNPPFDPPIPPIGELSDGVAQVLAMMIKQVINNQNFVFELIKDYYPGKNGDWFNTNIWNDLFIPLFRDENRDSFNNLTIDDLVTIFRGKESTIEEEKAKGAVEVLLRYIRENYTEVIMRETPKITHSLTGKDLQTLFPNATSVYIQIEAVEKIPEENKPIRIDVDTLPYLTSLTIEYAHIVTITNCENLTSVSFPNPSSYFTGATITDCPNLQ